MREQFVRTEMLIGEEALQRLAQARVAVFGIGGVGGYVCEALVRSGIGHFDLIDDDVVAPSNLNRQIIALHSTLGRHKTEIMRDRMQDINPAVEVRIRNCFYLPQNAESFPFAEYDYIVDAIDTVTAKLDLICRAKALGIPVISAMGAGNKLDPGQFRVADIAKTKICPLARIMRKELKKRGVNHLKVVYSEEEPVRSAAAETPAAEPQEEAPVLNGAEPVEEATCGHIAKGRRDTPGSISYAPAVAGLLLAGEVIRDLIARPEPAGQEKEETE